MDWVVLLSVLGSVASVGGAFFSIRAERNAKSSAAAAIDAKDKILKRQKTTDLTQILFEAKKVQNAFGKYSVASSGRSLAGVEFEKDVELLQNFIFNFNECRGTINELSDIETESTYNELNQLQGDFNTGKGVGNKMNYGKQIRLLIDSIIFKAKESIDSQNSEID